MPTPNASAEWPLIARFRDAEACLGRAAAKRRDTAAIHEFLRFGLKQAWACLFGGAMVALLVVTHRFWPSASALARSDALFLGAVAIQIAMLALRLETLDEAKVILVYHVIGTIMEVFKTGAGSWVYVGPAFFRVGGVPLFSGFMYASIGSYIARCWRLFDFRFSGHPPLHWLALLAAAIYANFYTHHYVIDMRVALFAATAFLFRRTWIHYRIWHTYRRMPLLLGFALVAGFIWLAENIGTATATWIYPHQHAAWSLVRAGKLGSWFLLLIVSYALVASANRPLRTCDAPIMPNPARALRPRRKSR
jgi:uncharacterized membrane protein YoaT (DUF817 family)